MDHQTDQQHSQTAQGQHPHGQQYQGQPQYQQPYPYPPVKPKQPASGFAVASLVLGIIAMVLPIPVIDVVIGVLGLIFAIVAKRSGHRGGMSTAGLVLSIIGTIWALWFTISIFAGLWWLGAGGGSNFFHSFM